MDKAADSEFKYALILREHLSSFAWLFPTAAATADAAGDAISRWMATFRTMKWVVSNQGAHFVNLLMQDVNTKMLVKLYAWANG